MTGEGAVSTPFKGRLERLITTSEVDGTQKRIQDVTYEFKVDNSIKSVLNTPEHDTDGDVCSSEV